MNPLVHGSVAIHHSRTFISPMGIRHTLTSGDRASAFSQGQYGLPRVHMTTSVRKQTSAHQRGEHLVYVLYEDNTPLTPEGFLRRFPPLHYWTQTLGCRGVGQGQHVGVIDAPIFLDDQCRPGDIHVLVSWPPRPVVRQEVLPPPYGTFVPCPHRSLPPPLP